MKDRVHGKSMPIPSALVNIKNIKTLGSISHFVNESIVGSGVTLTEIHSNSELSMRFPALTQAAKSVATNQIRNVGTLGGNLCQRPWCWYFRHPAYDCFKKGGKQCYAITGDNSTYFSIYDIGTCVMAHPSDTAPALIALDAKAKIAGAKGEKEVFLSDFFLGPKNVQDNILSNNEILVGVRIPVPKPGTRSVYIKHRTRNNWDFALASVAALGSKNRDGVVRSFRLVLGGVAPFPLFLRDAESLLVGRNYTETARAELLQLVANRAKPLKMNRYKIRIVRALVSRALEEIFGASQNRLLR
jgi:xanthine dehydrogenase YagS FAD-binding subunit